MAQIVLVAGEASGDLLAAPVLHELRARDPGIALAGVGGDRMIAAGLEPWAHVRELSVRGYVEVIRHLPRLLRLRSRLYERVAAAQPDVFVGIDAPDFNLGLEEKLRRRGVRTVQFVAPAVWAWRPERMAQVLRAVDLSLLIFPFEQALFDAAGARALYVGHPLASVIPSEPSAAAARARLGLTVDGPIVAVLPGSRADEIRYLAPVFAAAMQRMLQQQPALTFVMPAADQAVRQRLEALPELARVRTRTLLMTGRSHDCLEACDVALVASGTASLEAALFKRPMVISYRMPALSAWIIRRKGRIPYVGLPNILANEAVVPELLQADATAPALARAVLDLLNDPARRAVIASKFSELHAVLKRDTANLAAEAILDVAQSRA